MKVGMEVRVLPIHRRGRAGQGRAATVLEVPTTNRGRARVRFTGSGGTARVPIGRIVKPLTRGND